MIARRAAAALIASADFMLWNTLEKGQVNHFLFLPRQSGKGFCKQAIIKYDCIAAEGHRVVNHFLFLPRQSGKGFCKQAIIKYDCIAAEGHRVFFVLLWCFEILVLGSKWIVLFFCKVFEGYFMLLLSSCCPCCRNRRMMNDDLAESVKCVFNMLFVFFCAIQNNPPFLSRKIAVAPII